LTFTAIERKPPIREPLRVKEEEAKVNSGKENLKHTKWEGKFVVKNATTEASIEVK